MFSFNLIVLIDDDPINNLINKRLITKMNLSPLVIEFLEAEKALGYIETSHEKESTLILLDINMPVMNGWDFLHKYAGLENHRKDRIIMLSSSIDHHDRQRSSEFKYVCGFIEKPLTREKLANML